MYQIDLGSMEVCYTISRMRFSHCSGPRRSLDELKEKKSIVSHRILSVEVMLFVHAISPEPSRCIG